MKTASCDSSARSAQGSQQEILASLIRKFRPLVRKSSAFADPPRERDVTYLQPKLVGQFAFQEWTSDKKLRQPVFLGLRNDKTLARS